MVWPNVPDAMYQIFSEESQENADFENLHLMGVLFKKFQYWQTE
jgi:hypothetical protein